MAILYDWYENPGESDDSEEKGLHPRIFLNGKVVSCVTSIMIMPNPEM